MTPPCNSPGGERGNGTNKKSLFERNAVTRHRMTRFVVLGCCVFLSLLLLPCPLCVGRIAAIDTISFLLNHLCVHTYIDIGYILRFAFIPLSIIVKKEKLPPLTHLINHGPLLKMKILSSNTSILNLQISLTNKSILTV